MKNTGKKGEEKDMGRRNEEEIEEMRSAINAFVKSKGQVREGGFKEADAGALIPQELLAPQEKPEDIVDLRNYVKVVGVNSASGKYPVIAKSGSKMNTVEELAQNPELSKPKLLKLATTSKQEEDISRFHRRRSMTLTMM